VESVKQRSKKLIQMEAIKQAKGCIDRGLNGHDNAAGKSLWIARGQNMGEGAQQPGSTGDVLLVCVNERAVEVKTYRLDTRNVKGFRHELVRNGSGIAFWRDSSVCSSGARIQSV
jgi:hypothetical protein